MQPKNHHTHKSYKRIEKKMKRLAAAVAGAAVLSVMPSLPAAPVQAAANPNADAAPPVQQTVSVNPADHSAAPHPSAVPTSAKSAPDNAKAHNKAPKNAKKVLDIVATAYGPGSQDNDQYGSKTYLGTQVREGIIAVDPNVIPLGSRVYIQYPDGHGTYAVAEDTGGAIKGNRIDIAKSSHGEASEFGIQHVKVFVMEGHQKT